jgi:two-component system KDP operon response regulator KdpE
MASESILIVDDDKDIQDTLRDFLESEGYSIRCASGGHEAIKELSAHKPDLILLDLGLPDIEGHFVAARAASHWKFFEIPILVMSGRSDPENQSLARILGARDYLVKPLDLYDLSERIRSALGSRV